MSDPRHVKLAQVLVNHSLGLKTGDKVAILTQVGGAPLAREVYWRPCAPGRIRLRGSPSTRAWLSGRSMG